MFCWLFLNSCSKTVVLRSMNWKSKLQNVNSEEGKEKNSNSPFRNSFKFQYKRHQASKSEEEYLKFLIITFISISSIGLMGFLTASQQWCRNTQIAQEFRQRQSQEKLFVHRIKFRILFDAQKDQKTGLVKILIKDGRGTKGIPLNRGSSAVNWRTPQTST